MKKTVFMPVFIAIFALAGAVLRGLNLMHGYEAATKLPVPGDKAEMALIAVCGLAALALVILAIAHRGLRGMPFEDAFGTDNTLFKMISVIAGLVMIAAGGFGLYLAVTQDPQLPMLNKLPLFPLWLLAMLTGGCLIGIATMLSRRTVTEGSAMLTIIPMFWACFDLIITFKDNGASPFVGLYAFELLAAIALTYAFYALAGFLYSTASPSRFIFSAGAAVILCLTCVGGTLISMASGVSAIVPTTDTLLRYACFLASGVWLFAMLVLLSRADDRQHVR